MGKGDKKTRRGKIILGTFGARRRRKIAYKEIAPSAATSVKEVKEKKPVKEKAEGKEVKPAAEVKEVKPAKEKAAPKVVKAVKDKAETPAESKPKKEKKS